RFGHTAKPEKKALSLFTSPMSLWSGRIETRIGLRMMPTFPRSSLSFRTAGFPQYGWEAGLSNGAFLYVAQLQPAPGIVQFASVLRALRGPHRWHRSESGLRARLRTAMRRSAPPTPGALAQVRVVVSRSIIT